MKLALDRWPIRDFDLPDMCRQLPGAVSAFASLLGQGHRTYVHGTTGLGRTPLTVLGFLTLVAQHRPAIERLAHSFYEQGMPGDADAHWLQAQSQILRSVLAGRRDG